MIPDIDLVLRGMTGLAVLCLFASLAYFGFILMRVRRGRAAQVFFWAVMGLALGVALMALLSVGMLLFGYAMVGGGGVNWVGIASCLVRGWVLLSSVVAAVSLVMTTTGSARR